ncbi:DUF4133 domain-containing protein [Mucilaginibacter defluvii]|uniref:DUF4133 domain-containing protein n=1 Tax=Mucilaginibacter defluvii TaxID=1196019 RepID=A0ABP9FLR1_9SPHI
MASVYPINKGINKSIEFKGLKAQYIWYFGAGVIGLMILFAAMYIAGLNTFLCLAIILLLGTGMTIKIFSLSNKYGEHGMMKMYARKQVPKVLRSRSRKIFLMKIQE